MRIEPVEDHFRPFRLVIESHTEWVALTSALAMALGLMKPDEVLTHEQKAWREMARAVRDAAREQE